MSELGSTNSSSPSLRRRQPGLGCAVPGSGQAAMRGAPVPPSAGTGERHRAGGGDSGDTGWPAGTPERGDPGMPLPGVGEAGGAPARCRGLEGRSRRRCRRRGREGGGGGGSGSRWAGQAAGPLPGLAPSGAAAGRGGAMIRREGKESPAPPCPAVPCLPHRAPRLNKWPPRRRYRRAAPPPPRAASWRSGCGDAGCGARHPGVLREGCGGHAAGRRGVRPGARRGGSPAPAAPSWRCRRGWGCPPGLGCGVTLLPCPLIPLSLHGTGWGGMLAEGARSVSCWRGGPPSSPPASLASADKVRDDQAKMTQPRSQDAGHFVEPLILRRRKCSVRARGWDPRKAR